MPVPIKLNRDKEEGSGSLSVDYSFLLDQMSAPATKNQKTVTASNKDASLLFDIWSKAEKLANQDMFRINTAEVDTKDVLRLKSRGFLTGGIDTLKFTSRGRAIITTMALGETNNFAKDADKQKSYTEILASMDKKGKKGYRIPKYAASTSNILRLG